jgi:flagellar basal-body rod protein FlgC
MKKVSLLSFFIIIFNTTFVFATDPLKSSMQISASGIQAQQARIKIIAQNIANKDSISIQPGGKPYKRQTIILNSKKDKKLNGYKVNVKRIDNDPSPFKQVYNPTHPGANAAGYVLLPNIDMNIEHVDNKDAMITYEANLNMHDMSKNLYNKTIEMIR